jgi:hypothetical protein
MLLLGLVGMRDWLVVERVEKVEDALSSTIELDNKVHEERFADFICGVCAKIALQINALLDVLNDEGRRNPNSCVHPSP